MARAVRRRLFYRRKSFIPGNHEDRIYRWLLNHRKAAYGVSKGGDVHTPDLLSLDSMSRLSELGYELADPYPDGEVWLRGCLKRVTKAGCC